jgi:hypothetical protein
MLAEGRDAILAFRLDTAELGSTWTEICAQGTAVRVRKLYRSSRAAAAARAASPSTNSAM